MCSEAADVLTVWLWHLHVSTWGSWLSGDTFGKKQKKIPLWKKTNAPMNHRVWSTPRWRKRDVCEKIWLKSDEIWLKSALTDTHTHTLCVWVSTVNFYSNRCRLQQQLEIRWRGWRSRVISRAHTSVQRQLISFTNLHKKTKLKL